MTIEINYKNSGLKNPLSNIVFFADEKSGYDLNEGDRVTVRFVMTYAGGCFLPSTGKHAILKSQPPSQRSK